MVDDSYFTSVGAAAVLDELRIGFISIVKTPTKNPDGVFVKRFF